MMKWDLGRLQSSLLQRLLEPPRLLSLVLLSATEGTVGGQIWRVVSPRAYQLLGLAPSRLHPLNFSSCSATETLSCTYRYFAFIVLCKLCLPVSHLPIFDLLTILHFARQMLPLIYLRKLISQLPYLLLDGYMKLSNHLTFRAHRISNVLLTSFCYYRCTFCNVFTK